MNKCPTRKRGFADYASALAALIDLEQRSPRPVPGSCYQCLKCEMWHISSKKFTLYKPPGRGKQRRRLVFGEGA
jgi:hypothetical protein